MRAEAAVATGKALATAGAAAAVFGLTWWAVAAAFVGAAASYHFEPEQRPQGLVKLLAGIVAVGFAAALVAAASPHFPGFGWTGNILIEVRAGLLGLGIRWGIEFGKRFANKWAGGG